MRATGSERVRVKAVSGVRTLDVLFSMFEAGSVRFGATATMLDDLSARRS